MKNELARELSLAEGKIQYDNSVKRVLANKRILAWILKYVTEEFAGMSVDEIKTCIGSDIDISELEQIIHPCGFYKNKAKNIKLCAKQVLEEFNGIVPHTMKELTSLAGVGRKSANVIMLEVFGIAEGVAVDTHAKRISNLTGLSKEKEPEKIEQDLLKTFPKEYWKDLNHLLVWHGRNTCIARNPKCDICPISNLCKYYIKSKK